MQSNICIYFYKISLFLHLLKIPIIPKIINFLFVRLLFGCQIGLGAKIGTSVNLGYGGLGCVIHRKAIIGNNVRIGPGVVIGGTTKKPFVPIIEDNVIISSGAKILGDIKIGTGVVIGANSVVISSIPAKTLAVGIPAQIIKKNIEYTDY